MNYWISTDWHFNHKNIIAFEGRPHNYAELLINMHNAVMKPEDTLICLGDTIFADRSQLSEYLCRLKCNKKILVRGNHDEHFTDSWLMRQGFDFVCDSLIINWILLSHAPMKLTEDIQINLHGHFHATGHRIDEPWYERSSRHVLLALENTCYYPVSLKDVKSGKYTVKTKFEGVSYKIIKIDNIL